ncbi:hypothetical protein BHE90_006862 [Fusarium euwallaceae]|uniref:Uncharacterized protein n=2 Tax=Fusarium solani species complex TaxID=232080 RepID=A0A430LSD8_9HYPO|nr:hypothetical protein CEP51_014738 [Fusarium floridanum]RTE78631.1 hypothetical protein BHE90_006862 [Fusarium euwallaceae]
MKEAVNTATIAKENSEAAVNELGLQCLSNRRRNGELGGHAVLDDDKETENLEWFLGKHQAELDRVRRTWEDYASNPNSKEMEKKRHTLAKLAVLLDSGLTGLGKLFDTCPEIVDKAKDMTAKRMDNE